MRQNIRKAGKLPAHVLRLTAVLYCFSGEVYAACINGQNLIWDFSAPNGITVPCDVAEGIVLHQATISILETIFSCSADELCGIAVAANRGSQPAAGAIEFTCYGFQLTL